MGEYNKAAEVGAKPEKRRVIGGRLRGMARMWPGLEIEQSCNKIMAPQAAALDHLRSQPALQQHPQMTLQCVCLHLKAASMDPPDISRGLSLLFRMRYKVIGCF